MGVIDRVLVKLTLDTFWEALKDRRKIPNGLHLFSKIDPPEVIAQYLQDLASQGVDISEFSVDWLPEQPPNFMKRKREPSEKSKNKKTLKLGEPSETRSPVPLDSSSSTRYLNICISPLSSTPSSPPYYDISSDSEQPEIPDPSSPTLDQLQAITHLEQPPFVPETSAPSPSPSATEPPSEPHTETPSEPPTEHSETTHTPSGLINPTSEPQPIFPTLEYSFALFSKYLVVKLINLSEQSNISDNPSDVKTHWNEIIRWMTYETFKLKGLSEQARNDYIRETEKRLEARLVREDEERSLKEAEEKAMQEAKDQARKEVEEKAVAEAATAAEAEAKAKVEETTRIATKEDAKATEVALTQGESPNSNLASLVLKTLEELQKEQHLVRARLDQQNSVNSSIQNLLAQLLQRMPLPPNP
ncbi:eukaryotic translation initiation factor 4 gamma-like [Lathyrus oleraceus]|uniref:eukaryotic translation initiation factor 4 gamma-like n=1 Tax=Pisum sativum TaxID=3888 RepID=UPI0021CFDBB8|nr:eukaryotic translation initiation factor 4 gamma-like [Pisum sativum]